MSIARTGLRAFIAALLLALPVGGCGGASPEDGAGAPAAGTADDATRDPETGEDAEIRDLAGEAYFGTVRARVLPPEGAGIRETRRNGKASAELHASGRLVVVGDLDQEADAGFAADGGFAAGGWKGGSEGVELAIAPDGTITGGGSASGNTVTIDGTLTRRKLDVFFEIELVAASSGGFPPGTRFQFRYELWRPFGVGVPGSGGDQCREIVYRLKLVPNLSGGPMGMVQVPECRP